MIFSVREINLCRYLADSSCVVLLQHMQTGALSQCITLFCLDIMCLVHFLDIRGRVTPTQNLKFSAPMSELGTVPFVESWECDTGRYSSPGSDKYWIFFPSATQTSSMALVLHHSSS